MLTHSVLNPVRPTPIFGGWIKVFCLILYTATWTWWKQTMEELYSKEKETWKRSQISLCRVLQFSFFVFSCLSPHAAVILRVRWQQELPTLLKRGCFCSWQSPQGWWWETGQSPVSSGLAQSSWASGFLLSPVRGAQITDNHRGLFKVLSWSGDTTVHCSVDTVSGWNENSADFLVSCVLEAFFFVFFAISLGRNLSLVLQTMLPLREWCFSWHISSCPNCWQTFHLGRC